MYCSSCGTAINHGASYCNHCGARANAAKQRPEDNMSEASLNVLLGGILGLPIVGLGVIIGLMSVMKEQLRFSNKLIVTFTFLSFLLLLAAEGAFIYLLLQNRARTDKETGDDAQLKEVVTKVLSEPQVRRLAEPLPGVSENTTRTFEPIHRESKTR